MPMMQVQPDAVVRNDDDGQFCAMLFVGGRFRIRMVVMVMVVSVLCVRTVMVVRARVTR